MKQEQLSKLNFLDIFILKPNKISILLCRKFNVNNKFHNTASKLNIVVPIQYIFDACLFIEQPEIALREGIQANEQ